VTTPTVMTRDFFWSILAQLLSRKTTSAVTAKKMMTPSVTMGCCLTEFMRPVSVQDWS
jgi:hypothetical protein